MQISKILKNKNYSAFICENLRPNAILDKKSLTLTKKMVDLTLLYFRRRTKNDQT